MSIAASTPKPRRKRIPDERMLDAACREFGAVGYQAAAVDRIAADASITKATLYARFESKAGLFRAALARETEALRTRLLRAYDTDEHIPLEQRLHIYVQAYFDFVRDRPHGFKLLFVNDGDAAEIQNTAELLTARIAELVAHEAGTHHVQDLHRVIASLIVGAVHHGAGSIAAAGVPHQTAAAMTELFLQSAIQFDRAASAAIVTRRGSAR